MFHTVISARSRKVTLSTVSILAAALITLGSLGCGDDEEVEEEITSPFEGTYQVLQHTRNDSDCDSEGDLVTNGADYFRYTFAEEGDGYRLAYQSCSSPEECSENISATRSLTDCMSHSESEDELQDCVESDYGSEDNQWSHADVYDEHEIDACEIEVDERIATLNGEELRIERHRYAGNVSRESDEQCGEEFGLEHRDELECIVYEVIVAVPAG